ncbi:MAG: universal stress protein [Candidatus Latescibacterota bacterium]
MRAIGIWSGRAGVAEPGFGEEPADLVEQELDRLRQSALAAGVAVVESRHGQGATRALLDEARHCDLLVLGLPCGGGAEAVVAEDRAVLRQAECALLVVCLPPRPVGTVLVDYQGGLEGKAALRLAGSWAEAVRVRLAVVSLGGDAASTAALCSHAQEYLGTFDLVAVEASPRVGSPDSEAAILLAARELGADMIVVGAQRYGLVDRLFSRDVAEHLALSTDLPLLVAR